MGLSYEEWRTMQKTGGAAPAALPAANLPKASTYEEWRALQSGQLIAPAGSSLRVAPTSAPAVSLRTQNRDAFDSAVRKNYETQTVVPLPTVAAPTTGKTFFQKLSDVLTRNQRTENANSLMAAGRLFGNEEMEAEGKRIAEQAHKDAVESAKEFQYIAERGVAGAAKGVEGIGNALGYMGQMANRQQLQQNAQTYKVIGDLTKNENVKSAAQFMENAADEQSGRGLQDALSFGTKYQQDVQERYADADITKTGEALGGISEGVGGFLPSAAANAVIPGSGIVTTMLSAGGNAAQEALRDGAADHEALAYGAAVGAIEAATEKIFDGMAGVFGKGAADDVIDSIAKRLAKTPGTQNAVKKLADGLGEGFEEFISEFGQRVANELIVDTDNRSFVQTLGDAGVSFLMGAAVSGVIQAAGGISSGMRGDPKVLAQNAADAAVAQVRAQNPGGGVQTDVGAENGAQSVVQPPPTVSQMQIVEPLPVVYNTVRQNNTVQNSDARDTIPTTGYFLKEATKNGERRKESRTDFVARSNSEGFGVFEGETAAYGYRGSKEVQLGARQIQEELSQLAVGADITDGVVYRNKDDLTDSYNFPDVVTVDGKRVFINNDTDIPPRNAAGHEAFHFWKKSLSRDKYVRTMEENLIYSSEDFLHYQSEIAKTYLGEEADLFNDAQMRKLKEELFAYISGDIHEGVNDDLLRPMFRDYDAVKAAWEQLVGENTRRIDTAASVGTTNRKQVQLPPIVEQRTEQPLPTIPKKTVEPLPTVEQKEVQPLPTVQTANENGLSEDHWQSIMDEGKLPFAESDVDGYMESLLSDVDQRLGRAATKDRPVTEEFEPNTKKKRKRDDVNPKEIDKVKEIVEDPEVRTVEGIGEIAQSLTSSSVSYNKDIARNLDAAAGGSAKLREDLRNLIERPFLMAKAGYANDVQNQLGNLKKVMDELGIKRGSKESAAVQRYGEGQYQDETGEVREYTEVMLRKEFPNTWQNIVKAAQYTRQLYDGYVDRINAMLEGIYPNALGNAMEDAEKYSGKAELFSEMASAQQKTYEDLQRRINEKTAQLSKAKEGTQRYADIQNTIQRLTSQAENVQAKISSLKDQANICNAKATAVHARIASGEILRNKRLPKRPDYFHHFNEMAEGWAGLANILSTPADIDSALVGTSEHTKPKTKWAGFMQGRKGAAYTEDAIGGLLKYIPQAEYKIHIDPIIAENRNTIKTLAEETEKTRNANRFIEWMTDWTNDLAGKTNPFDRAIQKVVDRKGMAVAKWLSSRAKANAVVGNLRSATAQAFNIPNAMVYIKSPTAWRRGAKIYSKALAGDKDAKALYEESGFLRERYLDDAISEFDEGILKIPEKFANWMLTVGDKEAAKLIWASAYEQGTANRVTDPVEYADDIARRSIGGRGIGEVPLTQKATLTQFFAPFQVEVNNTWQVQKDALKDKNFGGLFAMYAVSFLMNSITRSLLGYDVGIDPINAIIEGIGDWDEEESAAGNILDIAGRLGGEYLSNMPFGAQIGTVAISDEMDREKLFGDADPSRFGTGNIGFDALADTFMSGVEAIKNKDISRLDIMTPLTNFALPYGGKQVGRIVEGAQSLGLLPMVSKSGVEPLPDAGSLTDSGKLRFAVDEKNPADVAKLFAFGPFSTKGGMEYLEQGYSALGESQTAAAFEAAAKGVDLTDYMSAYRGMAGMKTEAEKCAFIQKMNLTEEEKAYIYRYSMLSSTAKEKERTLFDDLVNEGIEPGVVGMMLMTMKEASKLKDDLAAIKKADLNEVAAKRSLGYLMGTDLKTEGGSDTEYAKILKAAKTELSFDDAIQMRIDGVDFDRFLEIEAAGVGAKNARKLAESISELKPAKGKSSVSNLQRYRAVVDTLSDAEDQIDALGTMMGESEFAKLQKANEYGVSPEAFVELKETLPRYDADKNGSYNQAEVKAAIDAMGIDDVEWKAVLWQLTNTGWKADGNPYNKVIGRKIYDAMH